MCLELYFVSMFLENAYVCLDGSWFYSAGF